ncbi:molybdate ABC transporter substrate-binding protein [Aneurinibacillus terranovensis]|uniref:molybdate ABC transporter substrate-binding protein n=1 Tax=Aneurinibacillus terranovensis TaxID=278991 RepID=UPI0004162F9D|nr:molybdate ABC transporter substrate-binding protein [Aneurinibacillus terranovensis]
MYRRVCLSLLALFILLIPAGCSNNEKTARLAGNKTSPGSAPAQKTELMISAAASLTDALNEVKTSFEQEHPNIRLTYNFGSSGKLAQQIGQGAPADVFLSASNKDMDTLQAKNLIVKDSRVTFAKNELVLITNKDNPIHITSFKDIAPEKIQQFAIGEPQSVPAGRYTKEVLENLKLWDALQSKLVLGKDVRQVLTYVESGNADLGAVYATDTLVSKKVKVAAMAQTDWHTPIVYPGAVIANSAHPAEAKVFLAYLSSDKGKQLLKKYGFK